MFFRILLGRVLQRVVFVRGRELLAQVEVGLRFFSVKELTRLSTVEGVQWNSDVSCGDGIGRFPPCHRNLLLAVRGCARVACRMLDLADVELAC